MDKSIKFIVILIFAFFCLVGCNQSPMNDDVYIIEDMDEYVNQLYSSIFSYNKTDTIFNWQLFHQGKIVTLSDLTMSDMKLLSLYSNSDAVYIDEFSYSYFNYDDLDSTMKKLFGASVSADKSDWYGGGKSWIYDESLDSFVGDASYGGEERKLFDCRYFGKYELDGDYLYIYDRCYYCEYDSDSGLTFFYNDINKAPESLFLKWEIKANYDIYYIGDEVTQKYGAEYKHTFAKAKNGSYYWVSSEPVK